MQLNTNLATLLNGLAQVVESGNLNISVEINVSIHPQESAQPELKSEPEQVTGKSTDDVSGNNADQTPEEPQDKVSETPVEEPETAIPAQEQSVETAKTEAVPSPAVEERSRPNLQTVKSEAVSAPRPQRPRTQASPVRSDDGRLLRALKGRQSQLRAAKVDVPEYLLSEPKSSGEAQEMLDNLKPYMMKMHG